MCTDTLCAFVLQISGPDTHAATMWLVFKIDLHKIYRKVLKRCSWLHA